MRSRVFVAIFFGLITLGHAYPYSYAWAAGRHSECGCNLAGRRCIHGCDLDEHRGHAHGDHAHAGHAGHGLEGEDHSLHGEGHEILDDFEGSAHEWVAPDCARQTRRQILSFQSDPFLPVLAPLAFRPQEWVAFLFHPISKVSWKASPETPPPRA